MEKELKKKMVNATLSLCCVLEEMSLTLCQASGGSCSGFFSIPGGVRVENGALCELHGDPLDPDWVEVELNDLSEGTVVEILEGCIQQMRHLPAEIKRLENISVEMFYIKKALGLLHRFGADAEGGKK